MSDGDVSKKTLIMGSCRVIQPFLNDVECITHPGGHTHSTGDVVQAMKIISSELSVPSCFDQYVFHGWGVQNSKLIDFNQIDRIVIEISSVKNYVHHNSGLIFHIGYGDNVYHKKLVALDGVTLMKESEIDIISNLDAISKMTRKKLVLVCQHNIQQIPIRYWLSHLLSMWCGANHTFIDPTLLVAVYGINVCFPIKNGLYDLQHYSDEMQMLIRNYIKGSLKLDDVPLYRNKSCPNM